MNCGLQRVIDRFPQLAASIQDRFQDDEGFREMCRDYADALDALRRWQASSGPQKAARVEEYRELARALEVEIATALPLPPPDTEERMR
jgi:hypothetical protein